MAEIIEVISTTERRGFGQDKSDPVREIQQYYSKDGILLWEEPDKYLKTKLSQEAFDSTCEEMVNWLRKFDKNDIREMDIVKTTLSIVSNKI